MTNLATLKNTSLVRKKIRRVGRDPGSKRGKTSGRGAKGDGSRSGYKTRGAQEGGQLPLYRKLPTRGFTRGRFQKDKVCINLGRIESLFENGDTVNFESLRAKGLAPREIPGGIKILGQGELKKKIKIEAHFFSNSAREKLEKNSISFKELPLGKSNT
jgi:large subunit ribosomal protein L15